METLYYYRYSEYLVAETQRELFESEFGQLSSRTVLLKSNEGFVGSILRRQPEHANAYQLVDIWKSKEDYLEFCSTNKNSLEHLSLRLQHTYLSLLSANEG